MNSVVNNTTTRLSTVMVLVALAASAAAQDNDMSSRMILELQQMREEVRELRGLVESQAQEIENLKRRQRDQYLDLDRRLSDIQEGAGTGSVAGSGVQPASGSVATSPDRPRDDRPAADAGGIVASAPPQDPSASETPAAGAEPAGEFPEVREPSNEIPEVATLANPGDGIQRQLEEPTEAEREAYDQAFRALRETRYADAAEGFDRFLRDHPRSTYAPNALYWLGEVYYVTRDFETALDQFTKLQAAYPDSGKQPDALLKIGFSHYELGQWERARAALEQVIAEYPGTNYSRLAENRLRTMRLEGNL